MSVTRCLRGSLYRAWVYGESGCEAASGHTAVAWRKWCSASLCLAEHCVMKRGRGERKGVCLQGRHGPRVPMQPGRMARWCRTASLLLTCHAAATLSFARSGELSFSPSSPIPLPCQHIHTCDAVKQPALFPKDKMQNVPNLIYQH